MTKNLRLWLIWTIITGSGIFLLKDFAFNHIAQKNSTQQTSTKPQLPKIQAVSNIRENLEGRLAYEQARLADPRTRQIPARIRSKELKFAQTLVNNTKAQRTTEQAWQQRGPFNIGGRTRALGIDINNESVLLAGGTSGGMWRSENNGSSWIKTNDNTSVQSVTCLVQDTRTGKTDTWYYGTGELRGNTAAGGGGALYRGNGIFKSTDGGKSWTVLASTTNATPQVYDNHFEYVWNLALDTSNSSNDEIYAATFGTIARSTDGGNSWTKTLGNDDNMVARYTNVAVSPTGVVFATLSHIEGADGANAVSGFYRSTDGVNWVNITPAGLPTTHNRTVLAISPTDENSVYFLTNTRPDAYNLWRYTYLSGDGSGAGGQWTDLSANVPLLGKGEGTYDSQTSFNMDISFKPDDANVMFISGTNLYRSNDGFTSTNVNWIGGYDSDGGFGFYPSHHPDIHKVVFYPSDAQRMLSATDGGVFITNNNLSSNVTWQSLNQGYLTTQFYSVAIDPKNDRIVGGMQDNGSMTVQSTNATADWERLLGGDGSYCAIGAQSVYISAQYGQIYRLSYDNQGNYEGFARIDPVGGNGYAFVNPFIISPNNQFEMFLPSADTLWYNSNIAEIELGSNDKPTTNWQVIERLPNSDDQITALSQSEADRNTLYYGTAQGKLYRMNNVGANTRNRVDITGSDFPPGYINCIAVNPLDVDEVIVVFSNYNVQSLYRSTNGGNSWTAIGGNLEENPDGTGNGPSIRWVSILPLANNITNYLVGTSIGLFSSTTLSANATTWTQEGKTTIGNAVVSMIESRVTDGFVAIATHGRGVFSTKYPNPYGVASVDGFALEQNFPNPFSKVTTIGYRLDKESSVKLTVFDQKGKKINVLVDEVQSVGNHTVIWNGETGRNRPVVNGVYFYELRVNDKKRTKRMFLLK